MYKFLMSCYGIFCLYSCVHEPTYKTGTEKSIINKNEIRKRDKNLDLTKAYKYHDLFTLQGIQKISNPDTFPYVILNKIKDTFKLTYNISADSFYKTNYIRKAGSLFRTYEQQIGMTSILYEEYIKPDRIIILQYDESAQLNTLASISVFAKNSIKTYVLDRPVQKKLDVDSALYYVRKKKMFSITRMQFSIKNDSIVINRDFENIRYKDLSNIKTFSFKNNFGSLECWMIYAWHSYDASLLFDDWKLYDLMQGNYTPN
jgi:hypothetical protein